MDHREKNHLKFYIGVQFRHWMDKGQRYNTTIFHNSMIKYSRIFSKQEARTGMNWCVLPTHAEKEHVTMTGDLSSGGWKPLPIFHLRAHLSCLVRLSTLFRIGFNYLNKIMIKTWWHIKKTWVSYSKKSLHRFQRKKWWL